ncbi:MAG: 4-(cytidine 5'-diphospho)-2-C-methyl-D-erythritol kinase, partial [Acidimicrobiia bacterium]
MTRLEAYAKVTLSLRIIGIRSDGFHELEALTVSATQPHDVLVLADAEETIVELSGPFAAGVPTGDANLVTRALHLLRRPMRVELYKGIPAGAGIGGGSADAAAVLHALGGTIEHGAALGSDVPFSMQRSPAWMRGRGEALEPVSDLAPLALAIAAPEFGCSTPAVYRAWDDLGGPRSDRVVDAPDGYPGPFANDLEPAAERVEPRLREFRQRLEDTLQRPALLCGSGSAYAAWFDDPAACDDAATRATRALDARVWS